MGHPKVVGAALALVVALAPGCATLRWELQKQLRKPGEHLAAFPEEVWDEYACARKAKPWFKIEENEIVPPRVAAGSAFNHRFVYVLCPLRPTVVEPGRLETRIRFRGEPIVRAVTEAYELKPGRWVVDAEIMLPEDAEPGVYAYEVAFASDRVSFEKSLTFVVKRR